MMRPVEHLSVQLMAIKDYKLRSSDQIMHPHCNGFKARDKDMLTAFYHNIP